MRRTSSLCALLAVILHGAINADTRMPFATDQIHGRIHFIENRGFC
jgi:hypothetical protein